VNGFELRRKKKKMDLYKAALELFSQFGIQKVSIAEIAKKANVSQVTIYNYFGNKSGLVKYIVMEKMNEIALSFQPLLDSDLPFPEKMEKLLFEKQDTSKMFRDKGFMESVSVQDPEIQEYLEEYAQTKAYPLMLGLLEQGRKEGYVNPDICIEAIMAYINAIRDATNKPEFLRIENQKMMLDLASLFFYGLAGKPLPKSELDK